MRSPAATVAEYIAGLPADRRAVMTKLRTLLRRRIPKGFEEAMLWGAITYSIPLKRFSDTYNGQPLCFIAFSSRKNYLSLYLMPCYGASAQMKILRDGFKKAGKKLDMGKSCVRFQSLDDLPLDVIGEIAGSMTPEAWITFYEKSRPEEKAKKPRALSATSSSRPTRGRSSW